MLTVFYNSIPINITLDSGATTSFITEKLCKKLCVKIKPNKQLARLGDGCTMIASVGEIDVVLTRDKWSVKFRAIVVKYLNTDIYGGMNFLIDNDISMRPKTGEIKVNNKHVIYQTNVIMPAPKIQALDLSSSTTVSLNVKQVLFPVIKQIWNEINPKEDYYPLATPSSKDKVYETASLTIILPPEFDKEESVVVGPRVENANKTWPPPQTCSVINGSISLKNYSEKPVRIPKDVHLVDIQHTTSKSVQQVILDSKEVQSNENCSPNNSDDLVTKGIENALEIKIDRAPQHLQSRLLEIHKKFSDVFVPDLTHGYNGHSGPHEVRLQFADEDRPRMSKAHVPKWSGKYDDMKQKKMDSLTSILTQKTSL